MATLSKALQMDLPEGFFKDLPGTPLQSSGPERSRALYWYDSIIDLLIENPELRHNEIAAKLRRAPATISLIINSDVFRARYAARREAYNAQLNDRLFKKMHGIAETALTTMQEVLDKKKDTMPLQQLKEITFGTLDRLGYSPDKAASPSVVVQNNVASQVVTPVASASALEAARSAMRQINVPRTAPAEVEVLPPQTLSKSEAGEVEGED